MAHSRKKFKKALSVLGTLALLGGLVGLGAGTALPAAAAETDGCGYGTGGPGADTICWIDMSTFDSTLAEAPDGQPIELSIGNYNFSFTARIAAGADGLTPVQATPFPTFVRSVIGNQNNADNRPYYVNTPGRPALYQNSWDAPVGGVSYQRGTVSLNDIVVTDKGGRVINTGYSVVMADAESTGYSEGFSYGSDVPINEFARLTPTGYAQPCVGGLTGLGTTQVSCTGGDPQGNTYRGALMVAASAPKTISASFLNGGRVAGSTRQGIAFGVMFSAVQVNKVVESRYAAGDDFTVNTSDGSTEIASAATGEESSATTGKVQILAGTDPKSITFAERATNAGTDISHYQAAWTCTRDGAAIPSDQLTLSNRGYSVSAPVSAGEFVDCTVTNRALLGAVTWTKVDSAAPGTLLAGSEWALTRPDGSVLNVADNDSHDLDPADGGFRLDGLTWGTYQLVETAAPTGYKVDSTPYTFNVSATSQSIAIGAVANTHLTSGMRLVKSSDPASGSTVKPGQVITYKITVTNTGEVPLTPAHVNDNMGKVLDNTTFVEDSAAAQVNGTVADKPVVDLTDKVLTWSGEIPVGGIAELTYRVKVNANVKPGDALVNVVAGSADVPPGFTPPVPNCTPETTQNPDCTTTHHPADPPQAMTPPPGLAQTGASDPSSLIGLGATLAALGLLGAVIARSRRHHPRT